MSALPLAVRYDILLRIAEAATAELDLYSVLRAACELLQPHISTDLIAVNRLENGSLRSHAAYFRGSDDRDARCMHHRFPFEGSGTEFVSRTRKPFIMRDAQADPRFPSDAMWREAGVHSYVRVPLFVHETLVGSLVIGRLSYEQFTEDDAAFFADLSRPLASAVSSALAYEKVARLKDVAEEANLRLRQDLADRGLYGDIVGESPAMRKVLALIETVAQADSTVLISGETGTGKELIARVIHRRSLRNNEPLITLNTAALPPALLASELFGHERGAFTGALQRRLGRFELASKGTIFLDEIGDIGPETQIALLRVLQEHEFERVGGTATIRTDARVIAATNQVLQDAVQNGSFRADLYYRLAVFPIEVPPLRHRHGDIPLLVEHCLAALSKRLRKRVTKVPQHALDSMIAYSWPGNVRELANVLERGILLARGDTLYFEDSMLGATETRVPTGIAPSLRDNERRSIEDALAAANGRVAGAGGAADILGLPPSTVDSKIKRLGIDKARFRHDAS
jgi:formate hydrogenlyase transcriptional activator